MPTCQQHQTEGPMGCVTSFSSRANAAASDSPCTQPELGQDRDRVKRPLRIMYATHSSGFYTFLTATHSKKDFTLPKTYRYIRTRITVESKFQKTTHSLVFSISNALLLSTHPLLYQVIPSCAVLCYDTLFHFFLNHDLIIVRWFQTSI